MIDHVIATRWSAVGAGACTARRPLRRVFGLMGAPSQ
jgi:hypothetical protein